MAKILVTHSYFYYFDPKQWKTKRPYPPLGALYASATLRQEGHEIEIFDNGLEKSTKAFSLHLKEFDPDYLVIYDDGFNYLTKMCLTNMREAAIEMGRMSNDLNIPVVISSSDSTDHYQMYLESGLDYVLLGEGEESLKQLIDSLVNGGDLGEVQGIAYKKNEEVLATGQRPVQTNLDKIPQAAWDLINLEPYQNMWRKNHGYFSLNISTTRGCPYKCNWCAKPIYGNRYNSRSPERVVKEMAMLQDNYGVDEFWVTDDIFGLKPNWVQDFERETKKAGRTFNYKIQSRVDLMLKDHNLEAMLNSGMKEVWVGAESGSQKILDGMDKGITVEQIKEATEKVKNAGRRICFFLQFGYLGETEKDIEQTVQMVLELMPDDIGVSVSYPLPGTGFYEKVKSQLVNKSNWTDSDDLDLMYQGNFDNQYYRGLHRELHKLFRRKQGFQYLLDLPAHFLAYRTNEWRSILLSLFYYTPSLIYLRLSHKTRKSLH